MILVEKTETVAFDFRELLRVQLVHNDVQFCYFFIDFIDYIVAFSLLLILFVYVDVVLHQFKSRCVPYIVHESGVREE